MLTELCKYLNNYFLKDSEDKHFGSYEITGGEFAANSLPFLQEGQYFRIVGSVFNDGVYKYPATDLHDEEFYGAIWAMYVPAAVAELSTEIDTWLASDDVQSAEQSPYTSESFGGYSYSKETGSDGSFSWQAHFAGKLAMWKKARINS